MHAIVPTALVTQILHLGKKNTSIISHCITQIRKFGTLGLSRKMRRNLDCDPWMCTMLECYKNGKKLLVYRMTLTAVGFSNFNGLNKCYNIRNVKKNFS
jgi:hypothetical protein